MTKKPNPSLRPNPNGDWPKVSPTAYIDPTAQLIGNVHIADHVYIGPNAVLRADEADDKGKVHPIKIAPQCNIQDSVIIHTLAGTQVTIARRTSITHGSIIHGPCTIGQNSFIGFRAALYNTNIEPNTFISTAVVVQQVNLPQDTFVPPATAILTNKDIKNQTTRTTPADQKFMQKIIEANLTLTKGYLKLNKTI